MVFSLQAIVIADHAPRRSGVSDCILRVAPRRSIRSRHCGMNEPIGSVQPVVLLKSLSKSYRLGGRRFLEIPDAGSDGAVRFGQIDSDEHYRLSGSAHVGRLSVLRS